MKHNQQLYEEYLRQKSHSPDHHRRAAFLQHLIQLPDHTEVSLHSSLYLLRELGVLKALRSIEHLYQLSEEKKRSGESWDESQPELWECRLISFLWGVIEDESVGMRQFKELLMILVSTYPNRQQQICQLFGAKQEAAELILAWDHLFGDTRMSSQDSQPQINDISIINAKCQGIHNHQQQQNSSCLANVGEHPPNPYDFSKNSNFQKSYHKKTAKSTLERSGSGNPSSKRTQRHYLSNYISEGVRPVSNFFGEHQSLTPNQEQLLVSRLYKLDIYSEREEKKRILQEERNQKELTQCTFKPQISRPSVIKKKTNPGAVKGFQQAINRMKAGYQKNKEHTQTMEFRVWKKAPQLSGKLTQCLAPKFHQRQAKEPQTELFELRFTLGKMSIPIKVRESDQIEEIVGRIGRIYSLKQEEKDYIRISLLEECQRYLTTFCQPAAPQL